jgi:hypothetical protein
MHVEFITSLGLNNVWWAHYLTSELVINYTGMILIAIEENRLGTIGNAGGEAFGLLVYAPAAHSNSRSQSSPTAWISCTGRQALRHQAFTQFGSVSSLLLHGRVSWTRDRVALAHELCHISCAEAHDISSSLYARDADFCWEQEKLCLNLARAVCSTQASINCI